MAVAMSVNYYTVNGMILAEDRGGVYSEFVPDTLGSCVAVKDASETITYTADYWPYGEVRTSTGSKSSPWGFVGLLGYLTDIAKRLYVRARHYRPNVGQWQTVDPLWPLEAQYSYVNCRPSIYIDPSGLNPILAALLGALAGCAVGGLVTGIGDFFSPQPDPNIGCKIGVQCLSGAIAGLGGGVTVGTLGAAAALGCLMGAISAAVGAIGSRKCDEIPGCAPLRPDDICSILGDAIGGCVGGFLGGVTSGLPIRGTLSGPPLRVRPPGLPEKPPLFDPIGSLIGALVSFIGNRFGAACSVVPQIVN